MEPAARAHHVDSLARRLRAQAARTPRSPARRRPARRRLDPACGAGAPRSSARPARSIPRRGRPSPSARPSRLSASVRSSRCCAIRTSTRSSSAGRAPIWVERGGRLERDRRLAFATEAELREAIERLLARAGRRADESEPICDARLPDGSRVNVVLPPLAVDGPALTIRRFRPRGLSAAELVRARHDGRRRCATCSRAAVRARLNVLVCGATGSGKTTTLGALGGADRRRRARRDDRGHGRAAPRPAARRAAGGAAGERRGPRRGDDPRARAQRAAHAARPDHRRRGPRAGGARHARERSRPGTRARCRRFTPARLPRRCAVSRRSR